MLLSILVMLVVFPLAGLHHLGPDGVFIVALSAAPLAPTLALFLAAAASNKVQGFALTKGMSGLYLVSVVAYFVPEPWQWAFGLVPTYWPLKLVWLVEAGAPGVNVALLAGWLCQAAILALLLRRFHRVMHR